MGSDQQNQSKARDLVQLIPSRPFITFEINQK